MTQEQYYTRLQDLKKQIEDLKLEYINSLPFKEGDFVRIKYRGDTIETQIIQVYLPIYNLSGERFNLLVKKDEEYDEVISYLQVNDIEVINK